MSCSKCGANLPDNSTSCPACGSPKSSETATAVACLPVCSRCGRELPEHSQFCLKCGEPVATSAARNQLQTISVTAVPDRPKRTRRHYRPPIAFVILIIVLAAPAAWIAYSDTPAAQELRDDITGARAQIIIETPVSVKPNNFSYYQFTVPAGSVNVTLDGDFTSAASGTKDKNPDNNVEVYLLTNAAFIAWRDGYSTGSLYESGRTSQAAISAKLPAGAGEYYLVFNNRFSPRTAKTIQTNVQLHYKALLSESLARLRETIWSWLGLN